MIPYRSELIDPIIGQTSFGIWDLLNKGSDPFGSPVRPACSPEEAIALLGRVGVPHISLHDIDVGLDPWITTDPRAFERRLRELQQALRASGVQVWMYTPCNFHHPLVRNGSVTANDARVRTLALRKTLTAIDVAHEFGASWVTLWLGRDGAEVDAVIDAKVAYQRIADAVHTAVQYIRTQGYAVKISLEPKPNEPRGDIYVSTVGTALGIIGMLPAEDRDYVGVNPELLQHEAMAGLNAYHAVGQLAAADKLAFLHLGGQTPLRYDQDHPFLGGNSDLKQSFYVVLGALKHKPDCIFEFDCHPFRTEAGEGAREEFVRGNLEALGMMMDKAKRFLAHPEVQEVLAETEARGYAAQACPETDFEAFLREVRGAQLDADAIAADLAPRAQYLDRLLNLHLLGYL